jgi:hypothetical protein
MSNINFSSFVGKTFTKIEGLNIGSDCVKFFTKSRDNYLMTSDEGLGVNDIEIRLDDIVGDIEDLVNSPIVRAEISCSKKDGEPTWTFYIIGTQKGTVTLKWYGTSNGYYSEEVEIYETSDFRG